jgi:flagellar assembly protein FliH
MSEILAENCSTVSPVLWRHVAVPNSEAIALRAAQEEQEHRVEQARGEGFGEGLASGRADGQRQVPAMIESISEAIAELELIRESLRQQVEADLIRLAITVAERVVHREMVLDPDALGALVKAAFAKVQAREVTRVRLHPALESVVTKTLERCGARETVLMPDTSLNPGELLFETSQGVLDASLKSQFGEIERALLARLHGNGSTPVL